MSRVPEFVSYDKGSCVLTTLLCAAEKYSFDLHRSKSTLHENASANQTSSQCSWRTIWSGLRTVRGQAVIENDSAKGVAVG